MHSHTLYMCTEKRERKRKREIGVREAREKNRSPECSFLLLLLLICKGLGLTTVIQ